MISNLKPHLVLVAVHSGEKEKIYTIHINKKLLRLISKSVLW